MDVSIIILNYNTFEYTCQCIESVIKYTKEIDYEIILVDNASVECDADLFKEKFPIIKLIKSDKNLGFSKGCNLGLSVAKGKTFLLLNSDVKLHENSIKICYEELIKENNTMLIGPKTINEKKEIRPICESFPSITNEFIRLFRLSFLLTSNYKKNHLFFNFSDYSTNFYPDWIYGSFLLFKAEVLDLFPEKKLPDTFFMYGEDMEWAFIIKNKKHDVKYTSETTIQHFGGKSTHFNPDLNLNMIFNNEITFLKKYFSIFKSKTIIILRGLNNFSRFNLKKGVKYFKAV